MSPRCPSSGGASSGFTLLEVLVAMALAGIGIAIAFAGISGATRLARKSHEHEIATRLAAAKLEEVLASPGFDLAPDPRTDRYAGVDYGYKIEVKPVEFRDIAPLEPARLPIVPHVFHEISVHMAAAAPNASWLEYVPWWDRLFGTFTEGNSRPPGQTGLNGFDEAHTQSVLYLLKSPLRNMKSETVR